MLLWEQPSNGPLQSDNIADIAEAMEHRKMINILLTLLSCIACG